MFQIGNFPGKRSRKLPYIRCNMLHFFLLWSHCKETHRVIHEKTGEKTRKFISKAGSRTIHENTFHMQSCRSDTFHKEMRFTNSSDHVKSGIARGSKEKFIELYE